MTASALSNCNLGRAGQSRPSHIAQRYGNIQTMPIYSASRSVIVAAALAAPLVLAGLVGCGDSADLASATLSKAEFVEQANAACNRGREEALATTSTKDPVQEGVLPAIQGAVDQLRDLSLADSYSAEAEGLIDALQSDIDSASRADVPDLPQLEDLFERSARRARALGVDGCAFS